ncbi:MAG: hypothetical protein ABJF88_07465 [Rhodothermales bacterium]
MATHLHTLLARSTGTASAIRPRRLARFESPADASPDALGETEAGAKAPRSAAPDAAPATPRAAQPSVPDAAPGAVPPTPPVPPVAAVLREAEGRAGEPASVPRDLSLAADARPADPLPEPERPRVSPRPSTLPRVAPSASTSEATTSAEPVPARTAPAPSSVQPPARAASPIADRPERPPHVEPPLPVVSMVSVEEASLPGAHVPVPPRTAADASAPSVSAPMLRKSAPASEIPWSPRAAGSRDAAAEAPTVHVHIGRIEVRAVPPPTPVRAARERPTPALTLDDYLSGRQADGRGGRS